MNINHFLKKFKHGNEKKKKKERKKKKRKLSVVKLLYDIFDKLNQQKIEDKCMYF